MRYLRILVAEIFLAKTLKHKHIVKLSVRLQSLNLLKLTCIFLQQEACLKSVMAYVLSYRWAVLLSAFSLMSVIWIFVCILHCLLWNLVAYYTMLTMVSIKYERIHLWFIKLCEKQTHFQWYITKMSVMFAKKLLY